MTRLLLGLGALTLLTAACESEATGPQCEPVPLSTAATRGDTVVLNTGLRYIEGSVGTGTTVAYCDAVLVRYVGSFPDGEVFDPGPRPIDPFLGYGGLVTGFEQGLIGMQVGGTRRLIVPPELGYGSSGLMNAAGVVVIPGDATLVFDVELLGHAPQ